MNEIDENIEKYELANAKAIGSLSANIIANLSRMGKRTGELITAIIYTPFGGNTKIGYRIESNEAPRGLINAIIAQSMKNGVKDISYANYTLEDGHAPVEVEGEEQQFFYSHL